MRFLSGVVLAALAAPSGGCCIREGFRPPERTQAFVLINDVLTPLSELATLGAHPGDAIEVDTQHGTIRIALDTGREDVVARDAKAAPSTIVLTRDVTCPARGVRVTVEMTRDRAKLIASTVAGAADPETLPAITAPRVLAEAENEPRANGYFGHLVLTASCDHVVFEHGADVYVAAISSGRVAKVARGLVSRH